MYVIQGIHLVADLLLSWVKRLDSDVTALHRTLASVLSVKSSNSTTAPGIGRKAQSVHSCGTASQGVGFPGQPSLFPAKNFHVCAIKRHFKSLWILRF